MYPSSPTETEEFIKMIEENSPKITDIIKEYIEAHDTSAMRDGVRYYENDPDIKKRKRYYYKDGVRVEDSKGLKPNNKIPHNWHRILVDQKASYLLGKQMVFNTDDEELADQINNKFDDDWDDTAINLVVESSNKGKEWLHPYIDEEGEFDYIIIPAEEGIPIYDNSKRKNLDAFIRHYQLDDETEKVELWDKEKVTFYEIVDGEIVLDSSVEVNPQPHFQYGTDDNSKGYGWGKVPFIKFANNDRELPDLKFYKELIDEFDRKVSDASNNLEEIQEIIYILKGYEGTNLSEFMENLLFYKAAKVASDGGIDTQQNEVPMESMNTHLDRTEESIWTFGQGVKVNTDKFGQSPSGVALKFLYTLLDLKTDHTERKFRKGLKMLMWFFTEYLNIKENKNYDPKTVTFTFNRNMITNDAEKVTMAKDSTGIISSETIQANHPWVEDVQAEQDRMKAEQDEYMRNMEDIGGGEDE